MIVLALQKEIELRTKGDWEHQSALGRGIRSGNSAHNLSKDLKKVKKQPMQASEGKEARQQHSKYKGFEASLRTRGGQQHWNRKSK